MPVSTLTLERSTGKGRSKKTRVFSVRLLGLVEADPLWDSGAADEVRPVWISYLGTDSESQAFTANFRGGHKATSGIKKLQILRSAPYRWVTHKIPGGAITTAYLPDLFHLEPPDPAPPRVRFVFAPPTWWVKRAAEALRAEVGEEAREAARAALFAAYLDRRTPLPVLGELAFHRQLYRAACKTDWVHEPSSPGSYRRHEVLSAQGLGSCGFDELLAVSVPQEKLTELLIDQTSQYQPKEIPHGQDCLASDRRLLPHPEAPAARDQLHLALA